MHDRIRVMHFLNSPDVPGGVEEHVRSLVTALPADRFEVTVVCPSISYQIFRPLESEDTRIIHLDLHSFKQFGAMLRLIAILRRGRIDIAHSHQFCATLFLAPLARLAGVACVVETPHVREAWRRTWLKRSYLIDRLVYVLVDRFIAVSEANRKHLLTSKRCHPSRVHVIYNGCDLAHFHSRPEAALHIRRDYGIGPADPVLVHIGRLEQQKGHRFLIAALPLILSAVPKVRLLVIGEGSLQRELEFETGRLHLRDHVIFAGHQADVRPFLELSDLVVLPSLWEGLPLVPIEAAAAGKPVVATAVDGTPEVVSDGKTGLLVEPGNPEGLARAIVSLLLDDKKRQAMGIAARGRAERLFSLQQQAVLTGDLYAALAHGVRRGRMGRQSMTGASADSHFSGDFDPKSKREHA